MCDTSNSDALDLQCSVASTRESLYWMGIDQPANGTILPAYDHVHKPRSAVSPMLCRVPLSWERAERHNLERNKVTLGNAPPCSTWKLYSGVFSRLASSAKERAWSS